MKKIILSTIFIAVCITIISCEEEPIYRINKRRVNQITYEYSGSSTSVPSKTLNIINYDGNRIENTILISILNETWDTINKNIYVYSTNIIDVTLMNKESDGHWNANYKNQYEIDEYNIISIIRGAIIGDDWFPNYSTSYNYNGEFMTSYYIMKKSIEWRLEQEGFMEYGDNGIQYMEEYAVYPSGYENLRRSNEWIYTDDLIDCVICKEGNKEYRYYYIYTGSKLSIIECYLSNSELDNFLYYQTSYTYDKYDNLETILREYWDPDNVSYYSTLKWIYEYENGDGNYRLFERYFDWKVFSEPIVKKSNNQDFHLIQSLDIYIPNLFNPFY